MSIFTLNILILIMAYFLGSIPTGFIAGKINHIDIRKVGSGNIGATNVLRTLGGRWGAAVLLLDALKGVVACLIARQLILAQGVDSTSDQVLYSMIIAAVGAILGHSFTCWLKFKGGKGVATGAGVFLALAPAATGIAILVFAVILFITRYVSLSSILAAVTLVPMVWFFGRNPIMTGITAVIALLIIIRHKSNIVRLMNGTENKIGHKK